MSIKTIKRDEIKKNSMDIIPVDGEMVLIVRTDEDKFYALSPFCPHQGAQLNEGMLSGNTIICPWHHACFDCKSGAMLEPPAISDLKNYQVEDNGEEVTIKINKEKSEKNNEAREVKYDKNFVIVGSGAAAIGAIITLVKEGFKGKITVISKDNNYPYDRTDLSKYYLSEQNDLTILNEEYFKNQKIEFLKEITAASIDFLTKAIILDNGNTLVYDKILIATGGNPIIPFIPGNELKNIYTLRSLSDADQIISKLEKAKKCVIIGSSFISMEIASRIADKGIETIVVTRDKLPFHKIFGPELSQHILDIYKKKNIEFMFEAEPTEFIGHNKVESAKFSNNKGIDTEFVILGVGIKPATQILKGIEFNKDLSVKADKYLRIHQDAYAAGDIVSFPYEDETRRIEHWKVAQQQGIVAALNMLSRNVEFKCVPFFWTHLGDLTIEYVGYAKDWDETIVEGNIDENKFIIKYIKDNKIIAAAGAGKSIELLNIENEMRKTL